MRALLLFSLFSLTEESFINALEFISNPSRTVLTKIRLRTLLPPIKKVNVVVQPVKPMHFYCKLDVSNEVVISRTRSWLREWVVGLKLCPWASASMQKEGFQLIVVEGAAEDMDHHVAKVKEEAFSLRAMWNRLNGSSFPTTLIVFPHSSYTGDNETGSCGAFPASQR